MASPVRAFTMAAGGHAANGGAAMYEGSDPGILLKPLDAAELEVYQRLSGAYLQDSVRTFIPGFHGVHRASGDLGQDFICLGNVLHGLRQPVVLDVKLGMRTHLFSESRSEKPRGDLFKKMWKDFPSHLTSAELEAEMVTKSRYMSVKDAQSTTGSLGYRVSGMAGCSNSSRDSTCKVASESEDAALEAFRVFVESASCGKKHEARIAQKVVEQLQELRSAMEKSAFVQQHECIGSSVLLAVDATSGYCRASWIDFAKTCGCEQAVGLSHRESSRAGSQEDGLLLGIDNLISTWECIVRSYIVNESCFPVYEFAPLSCKDHFMLFSKRIGSWRKWKVYLCDYISLKSIIALLMILGHIFGFLANEAPPPFPMVEGFASSLNSSYSALSDSRWQTS